MWQLPTGITPEDIIIYLRKSRADDPLLSVEEVLSKHEQMLDEWIARNLPGMGKVPEENRFREVVSGETLDSRPKVLEVLKKVESPRYKAVLIVEPQRLSRGDLEDIGRLVKLLRYSNTIVITLQYTYDLQDERDRDMFERELKRGNEFLEYQKRIMNNGRLLSVQNGNYLGTLPPYGYKRVKYKEGKRTFYTLEPIPEEAQIVNLIFQWYADGLGSHTIAKKLDSMGVPAPKGSHWSPESMKDIRKNVHYIGMVRWNHRKTIKTIEDGEVVVSRPANDDCLVFPGKHPAIIDQELWDKVQEIRDKIPPIKSKTKCSNPFAGLVFCECGRAMTKRTYKRKDGTEKSPSRLLCDNQVRCNNASILVTEMEEAVVKELRAAIADFEMKIKNTTQDEIEQHRQLIAQKERRLEELNKLEIAQWDKYTQEGMPKNIFDKLNAKVLAEREEVQKSLRVMRDSMPEPVDYRKKKAMFSEALDTLLDPEVDALKKNKLLKQCIERIEYSRPRKMGNRRWVVPEDAEMDIQLRV